MSSQENLLEKSLTRAQKWVASSALKSEDKNQLQQLISLANSSSPDNKQAQTQLVDSFFKDLEIGTGGMRGIMGLGCNRFNYYTIKKATLALIMAMQESNLNTKTQAKLSACISYDSRHLSREFAHYVAQLFSTHQIDVHLFSTLTPVPILSYAIRKLKAHAGVMITASHNPPAYNGYKIYWNDGKQATPPVDDRITELFMKLDDFPLENKSSNEAKETGEIYQIGPEMFKAYQKDVLTVFPKQQQKSSQVSSLQDFKVVYTALHGSAGPFVKEFIENLSSQISPIKVLCVEKQWAPDGNFPTVKFPNPEEKEAMKMAHDMMLKEKASIAIGTDPDGDRLGVIVNHNNEGVFLNGHQIGLLFLYYILEQKKFKNTDGAYFVKTIVTSPLQEVVAKHYNVKTYNTLTGFKWICDVMNNINRDDQFVFATEESFGYLCHPFIRDKDGISAAGLFTQMAAHYLNHENKTLVDVLGDINQKFGASHEELWTYTFEGAQGMQKINRIMEVLTNKRPATFNQIEEQALCFVEDYSAKKIIALKDGTPIGTENFPIEFPASPVLGFFYGSKKEILLYARPSGTEPKIKFYFMMVSSPQQESEHAKSQMKKYAKIAHEKITQLCDSL